MPAAKRVRRDIDILSLLLVHLYHKPLADDPDLRRNKNPKRVKSKIMRGEEKEKIYCMLATKWING